MLYCMCGTCRSQFSPLTKWDMGIDLRLADLVTRTFLAVTFQSSPVSSPQMFRTGTCFSGQFHCPTERLVGVPAATHSIVVVPLTSSGIKKKKVTNTVSGSLGGKDFGTTAAICWLRSVCQATLRKLTKQNPKHSRAVRERCFLHSLGERVHFGALLSVLLPIIP